MGSLRTQVPHCPRPYARGSPTTDPCPSPAPRPGPRLAASDLHPAGCTWPAPLNSTGAAPVCARPIPAADPLPSHRPVSRRTGSDRPKGSGTETRPHAPGEGPPVPLDFTVSTFSHGLETTGLGTWPGHRTSRPESVDGARFRGPAGGLAPRIRVIEVRRAPTPHIRGARLLAGQVQSPRTTDLGREVRTASPGTAVPAARLGAGHRLRVGTPRKRPRGGQRPDRSPPPRADTARCPPRPRVARGAAAGDPGAPASGSRAPLRRPRRSGRSRACARRRHGRHR